MALRLGDIQYPGEGLRLGSVQHEAVLEYAPSTWDGSAVRWDGQDVYWSFDDQLPPLLTFASFLDGGVFLRLLFSKAVTYGAGGTTGFTLTASGGAATLTYVSGSGTTSLLYSISREILTSETATLDYVQPTAGIQDLYGNDLSSFSGQSVSFGIGIGTSTPINSAIQNAVYGTLGVGSVNDAWMSYLSDIGYSEGSLNNRLLSYFRDLGYAGAFSDMWTAFKRDNELL